MDWGMTPSRRISMPSLAYGSAFTTVLDIWPCVGPPSRYKSIWFPNASTASSTVCALSSPERLALEAARGPVARRISRQSAELGMRMPCVPGLPSAVSANASNVQSGRATAIGENAPGRKAAERRFSGEGSLSPSSSSWSVESSRTCNALYRGRRLSS